MESDQSLIYVSLACCILAAVTAGCGATGADRPSDDDCESRTNQASVSACYTDRLFRGYPAGEHSDCAPREDLGLDLEIPLALVRGLGVFEKDVTAPMQALARHYASDGVSFVAEGLEVVEMRYLVSGTETELDRALDDAHIPRGVDLTAAEQERADQVVAQIAFRPLTDFIKRFLVPRRPAVTVVLLERVVDPNLAALVGVASETTGIGISPALFERLRDAGREVSVFERLELPSEFTPSAFLSRDVLATHSSQDNAVAHEVAHTFGLVHVDDPNNLMYPTVGDDCRAVLLREQADAIVDPRSTGSPRMALVARPLPTLLETAGLLELHRSITSRLLEARLTRR